MLMGRFVPAFITNNEIWGSLRICRGDAEEMQSPELADLQAFNHHQAERLSYFGGPGHAAYAKIVN